MAACDLRFNSRRSVVVCKNGCVACSQPLAAQIGVDILKSGGNAADAAVAVAAALNVTEPCSTGIGGDAFCLFYNAKSKKVHGLNGSGGSPAALTLAQAQKDGFAYPDWSHIPRNHGHSVTVPGAAAAWVDTVEKYGSGKLKLSEILQPAIRLAEEGFPVQKLTSYFWRQGVESVLSQAGNTHGKDMMIDGRGPRQGEIMKMPLLANTFRELGKNGKSAFYSGRIAQAIVDVVQKFGGVMTLEDLVNHNTTFDDPISVDYKGCRVWEMPPSGQGITALMALNVLEGFDLKSMGHNSVDYLHTLIEAIRLSFADTQKFCSDPSVVKVPIKKMLCKQYAAERRTLIDPKRHTAFSSGLDWSGGDTVYFSVVDQEGNACSFINSNYMGFGTGFVPEGCGFTLQNRGTNFNLEPDHANILSPNKRPYHTIIPAMVTSSNTGDLLACYGVMGGFMQPQGHVQVLLNMLEFGMDPQSSLNQPRFCVGKGHQPGMTGLSLEEGISTEVAEELKNRGHDVMFPVSGYPRSLFGRGQVITQGAWWSQDSTNQMISRSSDVYWAGTDPRADGVALGY
ncbi:glutathione hydrolase-like YwrD proenzyme [Liolophura sinensis]|uniref:glutathione hydrolase-like YwrD proenzyme n=1 Tax=Liolophura sinensis TaxID=3198878 RepID=UPI0031592BBA